MSGVKEVKIDITDRQWNDVHNRLRIATEANDRMSRELAAERARAKKREEELRRTSQRDISRLNEQLARQIREQDAKIEQQRNQLEIEFSQNLEGSLAEVRAEVGQLVGNIQNRLDREARSKKERAEFWFTQYEALCNGILDERVHYDHLRHGQMNTFYNQIDIARNMIDSDDSESATALLTTQFANLTQFRHELIMYEELWLEEYNQANDRLISLSGRINNDFNVTYDLDGNVIDVNYDYWTNGDLETLRSRVSHIHERLRQGNELSRENVADIARELSICEQTLENIENRAIESFERSEIRFTTAVNISQILRERGWECSNIIFAENEENREVQALFVNATGTEQIVLTIDDNNVEIDQFLQSRNEFVMRYHAEQIRHALASNGQCEENTLINTKPGHEFSERGRSERLQAFGK